MRRPESTEFMVIRLAVETAFHTMAAAGFAPEFSAVAFLLTARSSDTKHLTSNAGQA